ncbi:hypothetical protein [Brachyspira aalborgi]|uniref:Uncharacterized protein n=1 Tax=Brachyspira aalborgi TaxID=29522 RepID=A0A5C8FDT0_9SPIR|nr:hypothetical protein [Brachyspira aalborgi]TXJ35935.1 hypothetical protein EPJ78_08045 [Brachyspira aalborgi]TXJ48156.1 hypothetical protein EPJ84_10575 [Brachyspira aalborgi]
MAKIPKPTQKELEKWLDNWEKMENYRNQENALNKLFHETYPKNNDINEILIKVATLNDFYSTHILNIFKVAEHIKNIENLDDRLQKGDEKLVKEIAKVGLKKKGGKKIIFYSFATKFCSHHNDKDFAIYDRYVEKILMHFKKLDDFSKNFTKKEDLKEYSNFKSILFDFRVYYKLEDCNLKKLDRYLWQLGRKYFA